MQSTLSVAFIWFNKRWINKRRICAAHTGLPSDADCSSLGVLTTFTLATSHYFGMNDKWREKHHWEAPADSQWIIFVPHQQQQIYFFEHFVMRKHYPNASEQEKPRKKTYHFVLHLDSISSSPRWSSVVGKNTCNLYKMCIVNASVLNESYRYL